MFVSGVWSKRAFSPNPARARADSSQTVLLQLRAVPFGLPLAVLSFYKVQVTSLPNRCDRCVPTHSQKGIVLYSQSPTSVFIRVVVSVTKGA